MLAAFLHRLVSASTRSHQDWYQTCVEGHPGLQSQGQYFSTNIPCSGILYTPLAFPPYVSASPNHHRTLVWGITVKQTMPTAHVLHTGMAREVLGTPLTSPPLRCVCRHAHESCCTPSTSGCNTHGGALRASQRCLPEWSPWLCPLPTDHYQHLLLKTFPAFPSRKPPGLPCAAASSIPAPPLIPWLSARSGPREAIRQGLLLFSCPQPSLAF